MDRRKLASIWKREYPEATEAREKQALADLMDARVPGEEQKRPSVETLMHDLFPYAYVLHTHPSRVNGLTCGRDGKSKCQELFPDALWVPIVNPGYVLATVIRTAADAYVRAKGEFPRVVFLQNHGLVVAGDDPDRTKAEKHRVMQVIQDNLHREPNLEETGRTDFGAAIETAGNAFGRLTGEEWVFETAENREILRLVQDKNSFTPVSGAFSPDHVVYSGHKPLFVDRVDDGFAQVLSQYQEDEKTLPKIVAVRDTGVLACGPSPKLARSARLLFIDAVKVAVYAESFGGPSFLPPDQVEFIRGWEVEKYRERVSR
jgi:rhamnose utilization protein RhaD (predicted bifunctional aldolase and dehydrogenase)